MFSCFYVIISFEANFGPWILVLLLVFDHRKPKLTRVEMRYFPTLQPFVTKGKAGNRLACRNRERTGLDRNGRSSVVVEVTVHTQSC